MSIFVCFLCVFFVFFFCPCNAPITDKQIELSTMLKEKEHFQQSGDVFFLYWLFYISRVIQDGSKAGKKNLFPYNCTRIQSNYFFPWEVSLTILSCYNFLHTLLITRNKTGSVKRQL